MMLLGLTLACILLYATGFIVACLRNVKRVRFWYLDKQQDLEFWWGNHRPAFLGPTETWAERGVRLLPALCSTLWALSGPASALLILLTVLYNVFSGLVRLGDRYSVSALDFTIQDLLVNLSPLLPPLMSLCFSQHTWPNLVFSGLGGAVVRGVAHYSLYYISRPGPPNLGLHDVGMMAPNPEWLIVGASVVLTNSTLPLQSFCQGIQRDLQNILPTVNDFPVHDRLRLCQTFSERAALAEFDFTSALIAYEPLIDQQWVGMRQDHGERLQELYLKAKLVGPNAVFDKRLKESQTAWVFGESLLDQVGCWFGGSCQGTAHHDACQTLNHQLDSIVSTAASAAEDLVSYERELNKIDVRTLIASVTAGFDKYSGVARVCVPPLEVLKADLATVQAQTPQPSVSPWVEQPPDGPNRANLADGWQEIDIDDLISRVTSVSRGADVAIDCAETVLRQGIQNRKLSIRGLLKSYNSLMHSMDLYRKIINPSSQDQTPAARKRWLSIGREKDMCAEQQGDHEWFQKWTTTIMERLVELNNELARSG